MNFRPRKELLNLIPAKTVIKLTKNIFAENIGIFITQNIATCAEKIKTASVFKKIVLSENWVKIGENGERNVDSRFVSTVLGSHDFLAAFARHEIDGQAFLELDRQELLMLCDKLGPAVKISRIIQKIRAA
jgi:hypothetical protein